MDLLVFGYPSLWRLVSEHRVLSKAKAIMAQLRYTHPLEKPIVLDLCCGLGGWSHGFIAEGWHAIGFDIERHEYGDKRYPGELILADVMTLNGYDLRAVKPSMIVASPPCTEFSYMAMPWTQAKKIAAALRGQGEFPEGYTGSRTVAQLTAIFDACFRIARECGVPLVLENVKGTQPWVGHASANFGSYYLWGDIANVGGRVVRPDALAFGMPAVKAAGRMKRNPDGTEHGVGSWFAVADSKNRGASVKVASAEGRRTDVGNGVRFTSRDCGVEGKKNAGNGSWFGIGSPGQTQTNGNPVNGNGTKVPGIGSWKRGAPVGFNVEAARRYRVAQSSADEISNALALAREAGKKTDGKWMNVPYAERGDGPWKHSSRGTARKAASAMIAEIPFELASHIARVFKPH